MKLFIVESPGKVRVIQSFLGPEYRVKASVGHCYQIEPKVTAIDIENNYTPNYIAIPKKKQVINEIRALAKECDEVIIATDDDREGTAIGMHIAKFVVGKKCPIKRARFQEITKSAILRAIQNPTTLDEHLYNAQQARSVLDFLVGFKVSPILWKYVCKGTSAGRVQSIGLKLIVERQDEIDAFKPEEYWDITGKFSTPRNNIFSANYKSDEKLVNKQQTDAALELIRDVKKWSIKSTTKTKKKRSPSPLFNTASLQQFCSSSFGWDGDRTMKNAQRLYEGFQIVGHDSTGLITYHRTDSVNISSEALSAVRQFILDKEGQKYLSESPRIFKSKNISAQEAHEGIRPAHLEFTLSQVRQSIPDDEYKLYEAIYYRFVSCQMSDAEFDVTKVEVESDNEKHIFVANGQTLVFDGFLKYWPYSDSKDELLPQVQEDEIVKLTVVDSKQHFTKPPAAYNTASLVKTLEEQGIGRPSTYATIVSTLLARFYIEKNGKAFVPTELGKKVARYLLQSFPELMNLNYTARVEDRLDAIVSGDVIWYKVVDDFFIELKKRLNNVRKDDTKKYEETDIICPTCGKNKLVKRFSKYGYFYGCAGYTNKDKPCKAIFKIGTNNQPLIVEKKPAEYLTGVVCDKCGSPIIIRTGKKSGKQFGGCSKFPRCKRMFSLDGTPIEFKFHKKSKKD